MWVTGAVGSNCIDDLGSSSAGTSRMVDSRLPKSAGKLKKCPSFRDPRRKLFMGIGEPVDDGSALGARLGRRTVL